MHGMACDKKMCTFQHPSSFKEAVEFMAENLRIMNRMEMALLRLEEMKECQKAAQDAEQKQAEEMAECCELQEKMLGRK
jgi:hypothetical protein